MNWYKFPYQNFEDLNLDWVIARIKEVYEDMNTFKALQKIKWAGDWSIEKAYESWSIVGAGADGYISIKPVPIGVNITNEEYWVKVADYDILYSEFNHLILKNNKSIQGKKFILIGDSYATYTNANNQTYVQKACSELGLINNVDYFDFHVSGAGFTKTDSQKFLNILKARENEIINKSEITDIIVTGCANDQLDVANIESEISNFCEYVKNNYNVNIWLLALSKSINGVNRIPSIQPCVDAYKTCSKYGAIYVANSEFVHTRLTHFRDDYLHPTQSGVDNIAKYFRMFLAEQRIEVHERILSSNIIASGVNMTKVTTNNITMSIDNGVITIGGDNDGLIGTYKFNEEKTQNANQNLILTEALKLKDGFFYPKRNYLGSIPCLFNTLSSGIWDNASLFIGYTNYADEVSFDIALYLNSTGEQKTHSSNITHPLQMYNTTLI